MAADTESRVGSAQGFRQGSCGSAQYVITARMAVLVIYFFEAVQVECDQAERLAIAPRAIEFLFECFSEKPAVVEARQGIGHGIEFHLLEAVILDADGNTKKAGGREDIPERGFQGNLATDETGDTAGPGA